MKARLIWIFLICVLVLAIAGALVLILTRRGSSGSNKLNSRNLLEYSYYCGGNENGNAYRETVRIYDGDTALLSYSDADWYGEDPEIHEYLVSREILTEIEAVVEKYGMDGWEGKRFSDIDICDGETISYHFDYEDGSIQFSSQVFDDPYGERLAEIDAILEKYRGSAEPLPGLVRPELTDEEAYARLCPEDGQLQLEVYEYSLQKISFRILNGTDTDYEFTTGYTLTRVDTGEVISSTGEEDYTYESVACSCDTWEDSLPAGPLLEAGVYRLETCGLSCEFELR